MVERVTAGPVHQFDLGVHTRHPIVLKGFTWMEQQIRNPCDRDKAFNRVLPLG